MSLRTGAAAEGEMLEREKHGVGVLDLRSSMEGYEQAFLFFQRQK